MSIVRASADRVLRMHGPHRIPTLVRRGCIEYMDDFEKCGTSPPGEKQPPPELLALVAACDRARVRRAPSAALSAG
jgi:hypothetical protein